MVSHRKLRQFALFYSRVRYRQEIDGVKARTMNVHTTLSRMRAVAVAAAATVKYTDAHKAGTSFQGAY